MIQFIVVGLLFAGSLAYLIRILYKQFQAKSCASGCGKCTVVDFKKMQAELVKKSI